MTIRRQDTFIKCHGNNHQLKKHFFKMENGQSRPGCCQNYYVQFLLEGKVILKIWKEICFMVVYTSAIIYVHTNIEGMSINFPLVLVPVLGVVTSLLLVFRTNTAYERFWEARKLWSAMTSRIRSLTLCIWVGLDNDSVNIIQHSDATNNAERLVEKITAINLLVAFAYATKHYLRREYSYEELDVKELINHLGKRKIPENDTYGGHSTGHSNPPGTRATGIDLPKFDKVVAYDCITPSNIPLQIAYYLFSYIKEVGVRDHVDNQLLREMQKSVIFLVNVLTECERILRTPMPLPYRAHLLTVVWIYLLSLPYQLAGTLNWCTIPAVSLASIALLGILEIGDEIENPFGHDENHDLPLDDFCKVIHRESQLIVSSPMPPMSSWIFSAQNRPLAPTCLLNAKDLARKSKEDLHNYLAVGIEYPWKFPSS